LKSKYVRRRRKIMQEEYVEDLIKRINTSGDLAPGMSSSETISWKAYREAEKLTDDSLYPILKKLILLHPEEEYVDYRKAAYHILIKLLINVPKDEYFIFYLKQLEKEHDRNLLCSALISTRDIKIPPAIVPDSIIALTKSEDWMVRSDAIYALQSSATPESRQALRYYIEQEDVKTFKDEITNANMALGEIGCAEDIPILEKHTKSVNGDIRGSANIAIAKIKERLGVVEEAGEITDNVDENDLEWEQKSRQAAKDELLSILEDLGIKSQEDFENQSEEEGEELYERIEAGILEVYDVDEETLEELFDEILGE